jgi:3',5'-cyclic AMP phosphodiesterase CpdA
MFTLAHLSDWHLALPPRVIELASKRGLGFINWHRGRKYVHRVEVLEDVVRDAAAAAADHVAVTGDLVNLSLPIEYDFARTFLEKLGKPEDVTVIPGNHDAYVPRVRDAPAQYWGAYMRGDNGTYPGTFPFVRRRGPVALIALSSGQPTGAFMATGEIGERQLESLAGILEQTRDAFRAVLVHHPLETPPSRHLRRLTDASALRHVLAEHGAELVLHGHDHRRSVIRLDGPRGKIPVVGAPSASARAPHGHEDRAGYNLFQIDGEVGHWHCEMIGRQRAADGAVGEVMRQSLA